MDGTGISASCVLHLLFFECRPKKKVGFLLHSPVYAILNMGNIEKLFPTQSRPKKKIYIPLKTDTFSENQWLVQMYFLLKWSLFRGHVSFPGCNMIIQ